MKLSVDTLRHHIKDRSQKLEIHLSLRVLSLLDYLITTDLNPIESEDIDVFDLLTFLILRADEESAAMIADLMTSLNEDGFCVLDRNTVPNGAALLRDVLKADYIRYILGTEVSEREPERKDERE